MTVEPEELVTVQKARMGPALQELCKCVCVAHQGFSLFLYAVGSWEIGEEYGGEGEREGPTRGTAVSNSARDATLKGKSRRRKEQKRCE